MVSAMICHYLGCEVKNSCVKQAESELYTVGKCFNIHLILSATLSYSKFESIQVQCKE